MIKIILSGFICFSSLTVFAQSNVDREASEALLELEKRTGSVFSDRDQKKIESQLSKIDRQTPYTNSTLVCAQATGSIGLMGGNGFICYDWGHRAAYLVHGIDFGLTMGLAGGVGVINVQHDERESIEDEYGCAMATMARGFVGGSGLACAAGHGANGFPSKYLIFGGWNGGIMFKTAAGYLWVTKIE